ncbi:30S ribosomal protein S7 [Candidatus Falkowbacteria bacterium]|nr:30S ribosomal protein S7 [Candidatus Falkowbacteria bacterium]
MRGKQAPKRVIKPDPKYNSVVIAKLINYIMERGKKSVAQKVVYGAFDILEKKHSNPLDVFDKAVKNVGPDVEVRGRRIGGANYQIPVEVRGERKNALAFRWLIGAARSRKGKPMREKLAAELLDASNNTGSAIKKKEDTYRMAQANKAFAHFGRR